MTKTTALFTYNPEIIQGHYIHHVIFDAWVRAWVRASGSRVEVVENPECDDERSQMRDSYYDDYAEYAVVFPGEIEEKYYVFKCELSDFREEE